MPLTSREFEQISVAAHTMSVITYDDHEYIHRDNVLNILKTYVEKVEKPEFPPNRNFDESGNEIDDSTPF